MAYRYSLSKLFPQGQSFRVMHSTSDSKIKSSFIKFEFGKTYETDDEVLIESLRKLAGRYPKNNANYERLQELGVEFSEVPCQSCGGRVMKYQVNYFNIEEV